MVGKVVIVYPFSLNNLPKEVSSGNDVWQAVHDNPVCRAKLGIASVLLTTIIKRRRKKSFLLTLNVVLVVPCFRFRSATLNKMNLSIIFIIKNLEMTEDSE